MFKTYMKRLRILLAQNVIIRQQDPDILKIIFKVNIKNKEIYFLRM